MRDVVIAGGGIFGITAAIALRRRGFAVTVFDPGPLPHPLAESTDISKVIRMDYGADEVYLALMEEAMEGWRRYHAQLAREAAADGVALREGAQVTGVHFEGSAAAGLIVDGQVVKGGHVVLAAGAWTQVLLPELAAEFRAVGQPVFHLLPEDPSLFAAARFPVFGADISRTGYYEFPVTADGVVKIANHGVGRVVDPGGVREVSAAEESALRGFLRETFPDLADAPLAGTRLCVYGDTHDEHFWIARDPGREGLTVAAGGSGHGFKFAPVLGDLIADVVEGVDRPVLSKFGFRPGLAAARGQEAARHHG